MLVLFFQFARQSIPAPIIIGLPNRIQIASIQVDAAIESVAIAPDGSMDVPKSIFNTAWYELGPRPGEVGSAVIDGHVDGPDGGPAVFADLKNLQQGDKISVIDDQGNAIVFQVRELRILNSDADATEIFTSSDGLAHLNLITCIGVWDKQAQSYTQRLIVFADQEINVK